MMRVSSVKRRFRITLLIAPLCLVALSLAACSESAKPSTQLPATGATPGRATPGNSSRSSVTSAPTLTQSQLDDEEQALFRAEARDPDAWLASSPVPPLSCSVAVTSTIRTDLGRAVSLGPVHAVTGGSTIAIDDYREPETKLLWFIDPAAGTQVEVSLTERRTGTAASFFYEGPNIARRDANQLTHDLRLSGPFSTSTDAARGFVIFPVPGCYDIDASWDGGSASAEIWVYYTTR